MRIQAEIVAASLGEGKCSAEERASGALLLVRLLSAYVRGDDLSANFSGENFCREDTGS